MKVISYFSYKGGSGRTSLLYNTLPYLVDKLEATPEQPIIVMDLDVDSKGLSFLFREGSDSNKLNSINVLNGEFDDMQDDPKVIFNQMQPIGSFVGRPNGSILFVTADTKKVLNSNNYDSLYAELFPFIRYFRQQGCCKAIIFDNPAGSQHSGELALQYTNVVVTCLRITNQFRMGTLEFLEQCEDSQRKYIIVPNAVPRGNERLSPDFNISLIKKGIESLNKTESTFDTFLLDPSLKGINEVERFKFTETCLAKLEEEKEELTDDEREAIGKYKALSNAICE